MMALLEGEPADVDARRGRPIDGGIPARLYATTGTATLPRSWSGTTAAASSIGDLETADRTCRKLAIGRRARRLDRLPPGARASVPGGPDDCFRALAGGSSTMRPSSAVTLPAWRSAATAPAATWRPSPRCQRDNGLALAVPAARVSGDRLHDVVVVVRRERRGLPPHRGLDGLVHRPLPERRRRRQGPARVTAVRRRSSRSRARARHHRRVRPAARRGRGVRRAAARRRRRRRGTAFRRTGARVLSGSIWPAANEAVDLAIDKVRAALS